MPPSRCPVPLLALAALALATGAKAPIKPPYAGPANAAALAGALDALSGTCSQTASRHAAEEHSAAFQVELNERLDEQKARNDVEVYRIGHGRRETEQYMVERLAEDSKKHTDAALATGERIRSEQAGVATCVTSAEADGKALFAAFKQSRKKNENVDEAIAVMTAWLTNVHTIAMASPNGTDAEHSAWEAA